MRTIGTEAWFCEEHRTEEGGIQGSDQLVEKRLCHPRRSQTDGKRSEHCAKAKEGVSIIIYTIETTLRGRLRRGDRQSPLRDR